MKDMSYRKIAQGVDAWSWSWKYKDTSQKVELSEDLTLPFIENILSVRTTWFDLILSTIYAIPLSFKICSRSVLEA